MRFIKNQIDPTAIFVQKPEKGDALEIKQAIDRALVVRAGYTLVTAVTGKKIRVISYAFSQWNAAANSVTFLSNATQIYPELSLPAANNQETQGLNLAGWFETATGEGLKINTLIAGCDTFVRYIEVTP